MLYEEFFIHFIILCIGRCLSPDPYVQAPLLSQNYNRYSYCLNNPLRYIDPEGESFLGFLNFVKEMFINTFVKSWTQGINAWTNTDNWKATINSYKIDIGLLFQVPVWEGFQTMIGYVAGQGRNLIGLVDNVEIDWKRFAVLINDKTDNTSDGWGFTSGPYINSQNIDKGSDIYMHELGHTIQSRLFGPLYTPLIAIPSMISFQMGSEVHDNMWYEKFASKLGGRSLWHSLK